MKPEALAELERHIEFQPLCMACKTRCDVCSQPWPCTKADLLAYIRDLEGQVGVLTAALTRAHEEAWGDCDCREASMGFDGIKDAVDCWMATALTVETEAGS